jgi:hypothetical protein
MSMSMKTSHSTNFVSIWRDSSKNSNENNLIWRNDNSFTLTMSLSRIRICRWSNVFRNCVLIWMTFKKNWILIITTRITCEKFYFEHAEIIQSYWSNCIIHHQMSRHWSILSTSSHQLWVNQQKEKHLSAKHRHRHQRMRSHQLYARA